jgi:hypothetical protein
MARDPLEASLAQLRETLRNRLVRDAGATDADEVVDWFLKGIELDALLVAGGSDPVPSSVADLRALRLRNISRFAGRPLTEPEIQVLFRVAPTTASSILARMQAYFPDDTDPETLRRSVRAGSRAEWAGDGAERRVRLRCSSTSVYQAATRLLSGAGLLTGDVVREPYDRVLEFPLKIGRKSTLEALGLTIDDVK